MPSLFCFCSAHLKLSANSNKVEFSSLSLLNQGGWEFFYPCACKINIIRYNECDRLLCAGTEEMLPIASMIRPR